MKRRVLLVSGIRSDYDIQASVLRAIERSACLDAGLVVCGAHLSPAHGLTARLIEADGFRIVARIPTLPEDDAPGTRAQSLARLLAELIAVCGDWHPNLLLAAMDREEAMALALAGSYLHLPIAHLGGGDVTGDDIDDRVRHAVTRLAHLHLAHSPAAARQLVTSGEEPWRIRVVGAPGLDRFNARLESAPSLSDSELAAALGLERLPDRFALVIQHPDHGEAERSGERMRQILGAVSEVGLSTLVGSPNSDPGHAAIRDEIAAAARSTPALVHAYGNLPSTAFVALLRRASVLVGNSSCALVEAPLLGLPAVSVGPRQRGRTHGRNVRFVDYRQREIAAALREATDDEEYRRQVAAGESPYGEGDSGRRVAEALEQVSLDERLMKKKTGALPTEEPPSISD
jgi:GDP/UDP-N,N'-diacetylbacillosamine 2-epimerase (hydrolysing)